MEKMRSHNLVVRGGMMLGEVVTKICFPGLLVNDELALLYLILDPMEAHVNGLGLFLFDLLVGKTDCHRIVDLDWGRRLGVAHVDEGLLDGDGFLTIEVGAANLHLHGRAHDMPEDLAEGMEGAIGCGLGGGGFSRIKGVVTKEVVTSCSALGLWLRQV